MYNEMKIKDPGVIFMAIQGSSPFGAILFGYLSDRTLFIRPFIIIQTLLAGFFTMGVALVPEGCHYKPEVMLVLWGGYGFFIGGILPLMSVSYLQSGLKSDRFGRIRLFGTLGFMVVNLILIPMVVPRKHLILLAGILFIVSIIPTFFLPAGRTIRNAERKRISPEYLLYLIKNPAFLLFLMVMFLFYFQFTPAEYIISEYIDAFSFDSLLALGHIETIPAIWFLGTMLEIGFFWISPWLIEKLGIYPVIMMTFFFGIIRYASLSIFPLGFFVVVMQIIHGVHFSPAYLGSIFYLEKNISPYRLATAQAVQLVISRGLGAGLGIFFLGNLAGMGGFRLVFLISMLASALGLILVFLLQRVTFRYPFKDIKI